MIPAVKAPHPRRAAEPRVPVPGLGNNGIVLDPHNNRGVIGCGIRAFTDRNRLAWPSSLTSADVEGFPRL